MYYASPVWIVMVIAHSSPEAPAGSLGIPNRNIAGARGKREKAGKGLSSPFPFPIVPRALFFLSPHPPYDTKRPLGRREW